MSSDKAVNYHTRDNELPFVDDQNSKTTVQSARHHPTMTHDIERKSGIDQCES